MGRWQFEIVKTNWHVADVIDCRRPVLCLCWWAIMTELGLWIGFDVCMMRCRRSLYKRGGPPDITSRSLPTTDTHNGRPTRYQSSLTHWLTVLFISQYMTPPTLTPHLAVWDLERVIPGRDERLTCCCCWWECECIQMCVQWVYTMCVQWMLVRVSRHVWCCLQQLHVGCWSVFTRGCYSVQLMSWE